MLTIFIKFIYCRYIAINKSPKTPNIIYYYDKHNDMGTLNMTYIECFSKIQ